MTYIKSLRPSGVPKADWLPASGYPHRTHRSKRGRIKDARSKKNTKIFVREMVEKAEKKYQRTERKFK